MQIFLSGFKKIFPQTPLPQASSSDSNLLHFVPQFGVDPLAAELAAGRHRKRKLGLAAEQIAASRKASRDKITAKPPQRIRLADRVTQT